MSASQNKVSISPDGESFSLPEQADYAVEYDVKAVEEVGETYVLNLKAKTGDVAYDRLKMTVDKKLVLPTPAAPRLRATTRRKAWPPLRSPR